MPFLIAFIAIIALKRPELNRDKTIGLPGDGIKTEVINFLGPWKTVGRVEWETLKWVNWCNNERLHSAIGYITPQEAEEAFYANLNKLDKVA